MPRLISCPICKRDVLLHSEGAKVWPNLQQRIESHISNHSVADVLAYAEENMYQQALDYEKEIETQNKPSNANQLTCNKTKEPPCHLEPSKELCGKCSLDRNKESQKAKI